MELMEEHPSFPFLHVITTFLSVSSSYGEQELHCTNNFCEPWTSTWKVKFFGRNVIFAWLRNLDLFLLFKKNQFGAISISMFSSTRWWNKKLDPHHPPVREGRRARRCFATRSIGGGAHHAAAAKPQSAPAWLNGR